MNNVAVRILKVVVFLFCLVPFAGMVYQLKAQNLGADPVATLTHWTGDWALYMLLASLAITPLRRLSNKLGWMIRFRRMIGLFAFFYATCHLLVYVLLFSGFDIAGAIDAVKAHQWHVLVADWKLVWPVMVDDAKKRPFVQVGLLAWFILLMLTLTSPVWVLRAMGGKSWQTLHRTVYGAAGLAVIHYWATVKVGVLTPWKVTTVLAILLLARVAWELKKRRVPHSV